MIIRHLLHIIDDPFVHLHYFSIKFVDLKDKMMFQIYSYFPFKSIQRKTVKKKQEIHHTFYTITSSLYIILLEIKNFKSAKWVLVLQFTFKIFIKIQKQKISQCHI